MRQIDSFCTAGQQVEARFVYADEGPFLLCGSARRPSL